MPMMSHQIIEVSDYISRLDHLGDWGEPIMGSSSPKGAALRLIVDRMLQSGWSRSAIALTAVSFRLKPGGNLPSRLLIRPSNS